MKHSPYLAHYEQPDHFAILKQVKQVEQRDKVLPALRRIWEKVTGVRPADHH